MLVHKTRRTMPEDIYLLTEEQSVWVKALWTDFSEELTCMTEISSHLAARITAGLLGKLTVSGLNSFDSLAINLPESASKS